jgi:hypothetical protein
MEYLVYVWECVSVTATVSLIAFAVEMHKLQTLASKATQVHVFQAAKRNTCLMFSFLEMYYMVDNDSISLFSLMNNSELTLK